MNRRRFEVPRKWSVSLAVTLGLVALMWLVGGTLAQESNDKFVLSPQGGSPTETFNYQGYLEVNGLPANGVYDFRFSIWDQAELGTMHGSFQEFDDWITVEDGIFSAYLRCGDPADIFTGGARWLQIEVRPGASGGSYTRLDRQPITPAPYAWGLHPSAVVSGNTGSASGFGDGVLNLDNTRQLSGGGNSSSLYARASTGSAVRAESGGVGVYGYSSLTYAVRGEAANGTAGYFTTDEGYGLYAGSKGTDHWDHGGYFTADMGYGVYGVSAQNYGVRGDGYTGVKGVGETTGVSGESTAGSAVRGDSEYGLAVHGKSKYGWAGHFESQFGDGVYISAPGQGLNVAAGSKNAVVRTDEGSRLLYTEESTEVWFTDYGFGRLQGGLAVLPIDPTFAETVNLAEPYHVFVQVYGDAEIYVADREPARFEVRLRDGDPNVDFSYRIVAKRLGFEEERLELAPWADNDPNLYPEKKGSLDARQGGLQSRKGAP